MESGNGCVSVCARAANLHRRPIRAAATREPDTRRCIDWYVRHSERPGVCASAVLPAEIQPSARISTTAASSSKRDACEWVGSSRTPHHSARRRLMLPPPDAAQASHGTSDTTTARPADGRNPSSGARRPSRCRSTHRNREPFCRERWRAQLRGEPFAPRGWLRGIPAFARGLARGSGRDGSCPSDTSDTATVGRRALCGRG